MSSDLYFFNPTCEPAIANGSPYFTAPARLRKFESDLGYLPAWLGGEKDVVLVQGTVDQQFNRKMKDLGFRLPEIRNLDQALTNDEWVGQPKGRLFPWGWSPAVYQLFRNVLPTCSDAFRQSAVASWLPGHKELYSRLTAIGLLGKLKGENLEKWLPGRSELPVVCNSLAQIYSQIECNGKAVVKSPWSSSGRGLLLFPNQDTKKKNDEVLSGMIKQQGFVTVEPWLEKVMDLSYQFFSAAGKINYKGRTFFETDAKGRYVKNVLTDNVDIQDDIRLFLQMNNSKVVDILLNLLSHSDYTRLYEGWIGVDAIIYRSADGALKFHPMVEINGRFTMGAIALKIREYLASGSNGFMQIYYSKTVNFKLFSEKKQVEKPLVMKDHKLVSGFLPLTPPLPDHHFGAYIEVDCSTNGHGGRSGAIR